MISAKEATMDGLAIRKSYSKYETISDIDIDT